MKYFLGLPGLIALEDAGFAGKGFVEDCGDNAPINRQIHEMIAIVSVSRMASACRGDAEASGQSGDQGPEIRVRSARRANGSADLPELAQELAPLPREVMVLVHHGKGVPCKPETLGNWFKDQCKVAGLGHCTIHGIRKGQATRIVNWGGTPDEVMACLAHKTNAEGITYTAQGGSGALGRQRNCPCLWGEAGTEVVQPSEKVGQAGRQVIERKR